MMIRIGICDDEDGICSQVEGYVLGSAAVLGAEVEVDIFNSGESLVEHLQAGSSYDLLFLDIELRQFSGIDVSNFVRNILGDDAMQIVYVSGKDQYDRQLFAFRPFDFISKPFTENRIFGVIEKYIRIYGGGSRMFHYKYGHDTFWVKLDDIIYFRSADRKVVIRQVDGTVDFYGSLENVSRELAGHGFISPHKSYLINYKHIMAFRRDSILMSSSEEIPVARGKRQEIARIQLIYENGGSHET